MGTEGERIRSAEALRIRRRRRRDPLAIASPADFRVALEGMADAGTLRRNPWLSLYCLDEPRQRAIFVETPEGVELTKEPFLYQAQRKYAIRLLAVPYPTLHAMADAAPDSDPRLGLIYSCGRSGSTLLGRMFSLAGGCTSLSEPDVFTQMVTMDLSPDEITRRLRTFTWALCRTCQDGQDGTPSLYVVKFRSMCVEHAAPMHRAFPEARSLFIYRNVFDYVTSSMRAFRYSHSVLGLLERSRHWPVARKLVEAVIRRYFKYLVRFAPMVRHYTPEQVVRMGLPGLLALSWLSSLHRYLEIHDAGLPVAAVVYDDLVSHPESMLGRIFSHCRLESNTAGIARNALSEDAQRGTVLGVEQRTPWTIAADERSVILGILERHPVLRAPDVRVPGTLQP